MTGNDLVRGPGDLGIRTQHSLGAREQRNPGIPGAAREGRAGGPGNWEWPGSEGAGRPSAVRVRSDSERPGSERGGRGKAGCGGGGGLLGTLWGGQLSEGGGLPGESGAAGFRRVGPVETLNSWG